MSVLVASAEFKVCSKCGVSKKLNSFHLNVGKRRSDCKNCVAEYSRKYRKKNKTVIKEKKQIYHQTKPEVKRASYLKLQYGLTLSDYDSMLKKQGGKCQICKGLHPKTSQHKHFYIDHDHKTGKVRGLLCHSCNSAIGHFQDNKDNPALIITALLDILFSEAKDECRQACHYDLLELIDEALRKDG